MRRRIVSILSCAALAIVPVAPVLAAPAPAHAVSATVVSTATLKAKGGVKINKLSTKYVSGSRTYTLRPSVSRSGKTKVIKKTITVKKGSKLIAKNRTSIKLKPGSYKVTTKVTYKTFKLSGGVKKYSGSKSFSATQTFKVVKRSSSTPANSSGNCPSWAPIKGNNNSGIYHVPGGRYYDITVNDVTCFSSAAAAVAAGFRASKV